MANTSDSNEENKAIREKDWRKQSDRNSEACVRRGDGRTRYTCDVIGCDYGTSRVSQLVEHSNGHLGVRPCDDCRQSLFTRDNLLSRSKVEETYVCPALDCGEQFKTLRELSAHKAVHRDERPFVCHHSGCPCRSKTSHAMAVHSQTHLPIKMFKCPIDGCHRFFQTEASVRSHAKHFHAESPLFKCDFSGCDAEYRYRNKLVRHKLKHSNAEPTTYSCEWPGCDYRTGRSDALRNHGLIHWNHVCDWRVGEVVCGKRFRTRRNLYYHIYYHKYGRDGKREKTVMSS